MDVHGFLQHRVAFLRQLYETTAFPFNDRMRKIDKGESPFEPFILCGEDNEPPFLSEWLEADQSLQVLGQMTVSALAASLQLYLKESTTNLRRRVSHQKLRSIKDPKDKAYKTTFKNNGWFKGYKIYFAKEFSIKFEDSGADLDVLESLVLARNRVQHPDSITSLDAHHSKDDLKKIKNPFFVDQREIEILGNTEGQFPSFFNAPRIRITGKNMVKAFGEVELFCQWLEDCIAKFSES